MSEPVEAVLTICLDIECPECEEMIDLMDLAMNEEGAISKQAVPSGDWSEPHDNFSEQIECPKCSHDISVKRIAW